MMEKGKTIGFILGVVLFIILIAGITYAYITWTSDKMNYNVSSKCFDIYYEKGANITGMIMPSNDYSGGLSTTVKMDIKSSCNINATGKIYLTTLDTTSSNLYREGLLNYALLKGTTLVSSGSITSAGEISIDIGTLNKSTSATTEYTIYVWIDNNLVENSDVNSSYNGNIRAEATQLES